MALIRATLTQETAGLSNNLMIRVFSNQLLDLAGIIVYLDITYTTKSRQDVD